MLALSAKLAEPFEVIMIAPATGGREREPQLTRAGYFLVLKLSTSNLRSAAGVLKCTCFASIPASRNCWMSSLPWGRLGKYTEVDLRLPVTQE